MLVWEHHPVFSLQARQVDQDPNILRPKVFYCSQNGAAKGSHQLRIPNLAESHDMP